MLRARPIVLLLATLVLSAISSAAQDEVYYPQGYRSWTVAKFKFIGPESAAWAAQGGLRHHFANGVALASWGKFDDGAVIVDERVHTVLDDRNVWQEAGIAHVAVMRKDAAGHADTGGWSFNFFPEADTSRGITREQAKTRCFDACHKTQEARDYVFSDPRR
ncbi:MAG TPA: cytochrome P460 family protein [Steroidobacteraceae bacterium]|nr:cytochrome P460 family protein [Steroidobacteraceae bacterium]